MKHTIIPLALLGLLFTITAPLALGQQANPNVIPVGPLPNNPSPQEAVAEFSFTGGDMNQLAEQVMDAFGQEGGMPCNVVVEESAKNLKVPPFRVKKVTAEVILKTVARLADASVNPIGDRESQVYIISEMKVNLPVSSFGNLMMPPPIPAQRVASGAGAPDMVETISMLAPPAPKPPRKVVPVFASMLADGTDAAESAKRRDQIFQELKAQLEQHFGSADSKLSWHDRSQVVVIDTGSPEALAFAMEWIRSQEHAAEFQRNLQLHKQGLVPDPTAK